jgi:hypothetical protein
MHLVQIPHLIQACTQLVFYLASVYAPLFSRHRASLHWELLVIPHISSPNLGPCYPTP